MQTDTDWMSLNCFCVNAVHRYLGKEAKIGKWLVIFHATLIESGLLH